MPWAAASWRSSLAGRGPTARVSRSQARASSITERRPGPSSARSGGTDVLTGRPDLVCVGRLNPADPAGGGDRLLVHHVVATLLSAYVSFLGIFTIDALTFLPTCLQLAAAFALRRSATDPDAWKIPLLLGLLVWALIVPAQVLTVGSSLGITSCLVGAPAQDGADPTHEGRALQHVLRRAIAARRGSCSWTIDHVGWVVTLQPPDEQDFSGKTRRGRAGLVSGVVDSAGDGGRPTHDRRLL